MRKSQVWGCALLALVWAPCLTPAQQLREVFRQVNPAVVVVHTREKNATQQPVEGAVAQAEGVGSGVLVSAEGHVLTAAHVVQTADQIEVQFLHGERIPARVAGAAPQADLALLQLARVPRQAVVARLGDSGKSEPGDQVFVIGAPHGAAHSLAVGWISARRTPEGFYENMTALEVFQIDAPVYQGNSGGPVFNLEGEIIGVVSHILALSQGGGGPAFAVTSNVARRLMLEGKRVWVGVETFLLEGVMAGLFNVPQSAGLLVQSVAEGSLAANLGLREGTIRMTIQEQPLIAGGDIILEMLGQPVQPAGTYLDSLDRALQSLRSGDLIQVRVLRSGVVRELTARVP
ncbi:MAG: S1C family serine protease [Blastocatellia bacterium]